MTEKESELAKEQADPKYASIGRTGSKIDPQANKLSAEIKSDQDRIKNIDDLVGEYNFLSKAVGGPQITESQKSIIDDSGGPGTNPKGRQAYDALVDFHVGTFLAENAELTAAGGVVGKGIGMAAAPALDAVSPYLTKLLAKVTGFFAKPAANGLATGTDEAVFWSGLGRGGADKAAAWVGQNGGATLETTLASRGITLPAWDASNPAAVAAWKQASVDFAKGASGDVRVLQGDALRTNAIFGDEFRALQANPNVNSIRSINPETGAEVLLWSR